MAVAAATSVRSVSAYAKYLERECHREGFLFRGQREDKPLLPKIARLSLRTDVLAAEDEMLDEFKRQALPFLQFQPVDDWDWLALAQHYGMATRLLDWTANPIAALWFAVERPPVANGPGVVWVFDTKRTDYVSRDAKSTPFSGARTAVFRPRHITRRIVAQSGWFTVHKYIEDQKRFIALERNSLYLKRLKKVTIPADAFGDISQELDRFGFNDATLYADLDGLCRDLNRRNTRPEDEVT